MDEEHFPCTGCYVEDYCAYWEAARNCPCIECIIKPMCEKPCKEHYVFTHKHYMKTLHE